MSEEKLKDLFIGLALCFGMALWCIMVIPILFIHYIIRKPIDFIDDNLQKFI